MFGGSGDVCLQDRAGMESGGASQRGRSLGGEPGGASRREREVVEDGDLKAVPIQFPSLPSPEGRDAGLEAGDWIIPAGASGCGLVQVRGELVEEDVVGHNGKV